MIEKTIKKIKYRLNEDTMIANVIGKRNGYKGDIIIPDTIVYNNNSYLVTTIDENAFFNCKELKSVVIPNTVDIIRLGSFMCCESLNSINIPNTIKVITSMLFYRCESLKEIKIPNTVKRIGFGAFENCYSLETIKYNGTRKQWKEITLDNQWANSIHAKFVTCTDGYVKI